jgi:Holliday junction resolvase
MRRDAKVDGNQTEVVKNLRKLGCTVASIAPMGKGIPDLLVGYAGRSYLLEVKQPGEKLTDDEAKWHSEWRGQVAIVTTWQEAAKVVGAIQYGKAGEAA